MSLRERDRQTDRDRDRFCEIEAHYLVNCVNNISKNLNFEMEARWLAVALRILEAYLQIKWDWSSMFTHKLEWK